MTFSNKYSTYIIYKMPKKENPFNNLPFAPTPLLSPLPSLSITPIHKVKKNSPSKKKEFTPVKKVRIISLKKSGGGKKSRRRTNRKSNKKYRNKSVSK